MQRPVAASVGVVTAIGIVVLPPALWLVADRPALTSRTALALALATCAVTLVVAAATCVVGAVSRRPAGAAGAVVFVVAAWLFADVQHVAFFQRHIDLESTRLFLQATRAGVMPFDPLHVLVPLGFGLSFGGASFGLARAFARWGPAALAQASSSSALVLVGALALFVSLGERWLDLGDPSTARLIALVPFRPIPPAGLHADPQRRADQTPLDGGATATARAFARYSDGLDERVTRGAKVTRPLDLVIVHVESLRADVVTDELMPTLSSLRRRCISPLRHHSTGNNTGSSIFGLVTGLNGYHYQAAREAQQKPFPLRRLRAAGYDLHAHLTGNLRVFDGLAAWFFDGVVPDVHHYEGADPVASDRRMVEGFTATLRERGDGPHFDYLVIDSTHYDYSYPKELERFTPVSKLTGVPLSDVSKRPDAVKNAYKNAVVWVDALLADLLARIDASGRRGKMAIVVVGDHGEAFYEHRAFGHGGSMLEEETRTAFVLCGPEPLTTRYTSSSHADVMPTLFELVGMTPPDGPWTSGKSLLGYEPALDYALLSLSVPDARAHAIVMGDRKAYFSDDATPYVGDVVGDGERPIAATDVSDLVHLGLAARAVR